MKEITTILLIFYNTILFGNISLNEHGHINRLKSQPSAEYYINNGEYYIDINGMSLIGNSLFEIEHGYLTLITVEENVPTWFRIYDLNGNLKFENNYTKVINLTTSENKKFITFFNGEHLLVFENATFQIEKYEGSVIFNIDNFGNPIFADKNGKIHYKNKIYTPSALPQKIIFYQNDPFIFTTKKAFIIDDGLEEVLNFSGNFFEVEIIDSFLYIIDKIIENEDIVFNLYITNDMITMENLDKKVLHQNLNRTPEPILFPLNYAEPDYPFPIGNSYGAIQQYGGSPYLHPGVDCLGYDYQEVYAVHDGFVKAILTTGGDPYWRIAIANENVPTVTEGYLYAHLNQTSITVNVGDQVNAGDLLGTLYPWGWYDFTHIHFARLQDEGAQWFGNWWTIGNPLIDATNIQDTIPPIFENAINEDLFAFRNNGGIYLDPTNLLGEFDIIAKCHDIANSNWLIDIWDIGFSLNHTGDTDSTIYEKFSFSYDMPIDTYFSNDWTDIVLNTIYSRDATCYSIGNYNEREYYHIITNSNGDTMITEEDDEENFDSTDFLDGSYWLKVRARDASMNTTVDSMLIYFNNGIRGCTDSEACNYDPDATADDGSCIYSNGITDSLLLGSWEVSDVFGYNNHYCEGVPDTIINVPDEFGNFVVEINLDGILYNFDSSISYMWNVPDSMYTNTLCYYYPLIDDLNCSVFYELTENNYHLSISDPTPEQEMCMQVQYDKIILGCTDPYASNYNPYATMDDGSCFYCDLGDVDCDELEIVGCQDETGCNYDETATEESDCIYIDGICETCVDGEIVDNDLDDDSVCNSDEIVGCQDETGCNYDETATDEGDCTYAEENYDCDGELLSLFNGLIPEDFNLHSIYPNPFNPITNITYGLPENVNVQIMVYDMSGTQITTLVNTFQTAGYHTINWKASSYPSGVYLIRMDSGDFTQTQKVVLIK